MSDITAEACASGRLNAGHGTAIPWTHFPDGYLGIDRWKGETLNFCVGCAKTASSACSNCYATRAVRSVAAKFADSNPALAARYAALVTDDGDDWTGEVDYFPERLDRCLRWRAPRSVFVDSLSDPWYARVDRSIVDRFVDVVSQSWPHRYMVLTKRPRVMAEHTAGRGGFPPNLWVGTSIGEPRFVWFLDAVRDTDAHVRFVSFEPLVAKLGDVDLTSFDWVIVGGESGPGHRPMDRAWAADIKAQCDDLGIAFFFKQGHGPRAGMNPDLLGRVHHNWPELDGDALHGNKARPDDEPVD